MMATLAFNELMKVDVRPTCWTCFLWPILTFLFIINNIKFLKLTGFHNFLLLGENEKWGQEKIFK